jgi:signal transduction histidine kinase
MTDANNTYEASPNVAESAEDAAAESNKMEFASTPLLARLEALLNISRKVADGSDESAIFQSIVEDAQKGLSADYALLILPHGDGKHLHVVAQCGFPESDAINAERFMLGFDQHPLVHRVFESEQALAVQDLNVIDRDSTPISRDYEIRSFYIAPIKYGKEMIGLLGVIYKNTPHDWTPDETGWLTALTDQAAVALTLRRTMQNQSRSILVREALHTASRRLQSSQDIETVIEATLQGVAQVVPSIGTSIHLLSDDGNTATVAGIRGFEHKTGPFDSKAAMGYTYSARDSKLNSRTLHDHEAFFLVDFQAEADTWANAQMPTLRAWMSVPLIANNKCLGKITVDHDMAGAYGPEELAIVQTFAAHAAVAIERARLYSETTNRASQFAALARSARSLVSNLDMRAVLQAVVDNARTLTDGEACLMLFQPATDTLEPCAFAWGGPWHVGAEDASAASLEQSVCLNALREQKIIVIQDLAAEPYSQSLIDLKVRSVIALPLSVGEERLGVLEIAWAEPNRADTAVVALCTAFAEHVALAIHNARQHDEMLKREQERTILLRQLMTAQENERKLVALELHDGPLQSLGVGLINADALRKKMQTGRTVTATDIDDLRRYFASVVDEIRGLMADLRPEVLDSYGLLAGLEAYCRRLREIVPFEIGILYDLRERQPSFIELLIYRLVQEALNNVRKHANASQATVAIHADRASNSVVVEVKDNGNGFDPDALPGRREGFGLGIKSMQERAESAGGTMEIESARGKGTTISFRIPMPT